MNYSHLHHFSDAPAQLTGPLLFFAGFIIGLGVGLLFWYRSRPRNVVAASQEPRRPIAATVQGEKQADRDVPVTTPPAASLPKLDKNDKISHIQQKYGDKNPETNPYYKKSIGTESLAVAGDVKGALAKLIDRIKNPPNPLSKKAEQEIHAKLDALKVGQAAQPTEKSTYSDKDYEQPENKS